MLSTRSLPGLHPHHPHSLPPPLPPGYAGPFSPLRPAPLGAPRHFKVPNVPTTSALGKFRRGALIQLGTGELRRIEDISTEDFVKSAEGNHALRLAPGRVVAIGLGVVTLRHGTRDAEIDVAPEQPFFVYGRGWASLSPEHSLRILGLRCRTLHVGDVCVAVAPRIASGSATSTCSSETTIPTPPGPLGPPTCHRLAHPLPLDRKRRWSAPEEIDPTVDLPLSLAPQPIQPAIPLPTRPTPLQLHPAHLQEMPPHLHHRYHPPIHHPYYLE